MSRRSLSAWSSSSRPTTADSRCPRNSAARARSAARSARVDLGQLSHRLIAQVRGAVELHGRVSERPSLRNTRQPGTTGPPCRPPRATARAPAATARPPEPRRSAGPRPAPPGSASRSPRRGPRRAASARRPRLGAGSAVPARAAASRRCSSTDSGRTRRRRIASASSGCRSWTSWSPVGCRSRRSASWCSPAASSADASVVTVAQQSVGQGAVRDPERAGDPPCRLVEAVEPPVEQVGEDLGQRLVVAGLGDELLGEQRLTGRAPVDPVDRRRVGTLAGQQRQLLRGPVAGQRAQRELVHDGQPADPGEPVEGRRRDGRVVLAPGADDRQARTGGEQVLEQVEGRRVRPVQVLDDARPAAAGRPARPASSRRR